MFHNGVLKNIFRPRSEKLTGDCKMLQNERLHDLNCTRIITLEISSRLTRSVGHVERMVERTGVYRV